MVVETDLTALHISLPYTRLLPDYLSYSDFERERRSLSLSNLL